MRIHPENTFRKEMFMSRIVKSAGALALAIALTGTAGVRPAAAQDEPFLGQIMMVGYTFCPRGWTEADGQLLPISSNSALFSLYGTTYGGDGRTTFALPDLRGRVPMHTGSGPGLSPRQMGQAGGTETNTLTAGNMPAHSHSLNALSANGTTPAPGGNLIAGAGREVIYGSGTPDAQMSGNAIGSAGGGQAVNNLQPFQVVRYCVALQGIYPSRN
jgi:microcystin-dependent protein